MRTVTSSFAYTDGICDQLERSDSVCDVTAERFPPVQTGADQLCYIYTMSQVFVNKLFAGQGVF